MAPVQDMIKQVEDENLQQTIARSKANPGALQVGGTVRYTAGGLLPPTEIKNQAYTGTGVSQGAQTNLDAIARANQAEIDNKANRAAQNKADIAAANAPSTPTRYSATGELNASGSAQAPGGVLTADEYAAKFGSKPVDEAAIRERVRSENQGRIDAINAAYDAMASQQQTSNISNLGSTRAVGARSGLLGSDFGNAALVNQEQAGNKALAAINAERADKVAATLADVNLRIDQKIQAERDAAKMNANEYKDYYDKAQAAVKDSVKNLGASGVSFDQLKEKDPAQLKKLLDSTGYDEFALATVMNAAKKPAEKINYTFKTVGNKVIGYGLNPLTNQIETIEKDLPAGEASNLQDYTPHTLADGTLLFTPKQLDPTKSLKDQVLMYGAEGQFAKEAAPITKIVNKQLYTSLDGGKTWKIGANGAAATGGGTVRKTGGGGSVVKVSETKAIQKLQSGLANTDVLGSDGFMSPDNYLAFRNAWIKDGYSATSFDTKMKGYRNPNNLDYIINKQ